MVFVAFKLDEICVDQCVLDVSVSKLLHNVKDAPCFVIFHRCFPVSEGVKLLFAEALELLSFFASLFLCVMKLFRCTLSNPFPKIFSLFLGRALSMAIELLRNFQHPWVATLFRRNFQDYSVQFDR